MNKPGHDIKLANDFRLPSVGLGTWPMEDSDATSQHIAQAIDKGYRLIDTARTYGNHRAVGQAISRAIESNSVGRDQLTIVDKIDPEDYGFASTLKAFDESLDQLGLSYIDIVLLHHPTVDSELTIQSWRALERLYREGRVGAIGVSNFWPEQLEQLRYRDLTTPMVNQILLNPYKPQHNTYEYCLRHDIVLQSYSPLGQGGKLLDEPIVRDLSDKYEKTPAQIILRWHLEKGSAPLPRTQQTKRLDENVNIFDFTLSDEDMSQLAQLDNQEA